MAPIHGNGDFLLYGSPRISAGLLFLACFTRLASFDLRWVQAALAAQGKDGGGGQWPSAHAAHLQPRAKMGGGSKACFAWLTLRLAQGKVGRGEAKLALLALLGLHLLALAECWG